MSGIERGGPALTDAYIGVGANIEPEANIERGLRRLAQVAELAALSTFYRTPALERPGLPDFLNGVCRIRTAMAPHSLKFDVLRRIEMDLGRMRGNDPYAPRTLDLDILVFGEYALDTDGLRIPDPQIRERPFLSRPLYELAPDLILTDRGEPLADVVEKHREAPLTPDVAFTKRLKERLNIP